MGSLRRKNPQTAVQSDRYQGGLMPSPLAGKPRWLRSRAPTSPEFLKLRNVVRGNRLHTVCESATCPNIGRCWHEGSAAFMILGGICTRNCAFCDIPTGHPEPIDHQEPARLVEAVQALSLRHVVITSVDRDDLDDGGARQFAACVEALRRHDETVTIEVLTPDFRGKAGALQSVLASGPDVFNHNVETVPSLYRDVRPAADYRGSLDLLATAADWAAHLPTEQRPMAIKSGLMLGLGESWQEILTTLDDLRTANVEWLTVGQYLRPGLEHHPVVAYWLPEAFEELKQHALNMGFTHVESHPLARSSFHAEQAVHTTHSSQQDL
ncbi:MAG: lipoyl synthase [Magnetococcales bacterium]|nr:lipoyl synthase [Magnetococcales bacterium]